MLCPTADSELMSLKLDGLLDPAQELQLNRHIESCADCTLIWNALKQTNDMLWASALEPLPVPSSFHAKVMMRIAAPVPALSPEHAPFFQPAAAVASVAVAAHTTVLPQAHAPVHGHTRRLGAAPTLYLPGIYAEWQSRVASYIKGAAAVALSVAGTLGLLLALLLSGAIQLSGPAADFVGVLRTFFQGIDTWARSIFVNFGLAPVAVGGLMLGIMLLVGWQVVSGYQRSAAENRGNTGALEALA